MRRFAISLFVLLAWRTFAAELKLPQYTRTVLSNVWNHQDASLGGVALATLMGGASGAIIGTFSTAASSVNEVTQLSSALLTAVKADPAKFITLGFAVLAGAGWALSAYSASLKPYGRN